MRRAVLVLVLCLGFARLASADEPAWRNVADPVFTRIDQKALPHPAVYAVTQDAAGFIWAGTPGGLARYDGHRFRSYPEVGVQALVADPRGRLWIGTPSSGLAALDESTETFHAWHADPSGRTGPHSATVIALARTRDGDLWVGGDSGLDLFDVDGGTFHRAELDDPQPRVEAILVDHEETVWVATIHGLFHRRRSETTFHRLLLSGVDDSATRTYFSLHEDRAGRLWIGSVNAVFVLGKDRTLEQTYSSSNGLVPGEQWGIIEVTPGIFWIASYDGGISILDTAAGHARRIAVDRGNPGGFTPGDVWQFFRDRSGLIWIANGPGGLLAHNPLNRGIYELTSSDKRPGAGDQGARAVAPAPNGALWLGGSDKVALLDPHASSSTAFTVPNHRRVQTLHSGESGTLWIGTVEGLCRLTQQTIECPSGFYQSVGRVFSILESSGMLWVGSGAGVFALDEKSGEVTRYRRESLSNEFVTVLYRDSAGRIWAGTTNGVNRIDPQTKRVTRFIHDPKNPDSLGPGPVTSIVEDRTHRIWTGAAGGPLNVIAEQRVRHLGSAEGVPESIAGLAEDADGTIWASSTNTVVRIDPHTFRARVLGPADGVQETEFWTRGVTRAPDGTIFFAGILGVTVIAPEATANWTYSPPVAMTSLTVGDRTLATSSGAVDLRPGARDITIEFAALDYSAPDALRYAFMLDGYSRAWTDADASHRVATYTNVSPGNYTLRVRATNRLGTWSSNAIALSVHALPAWYETWWFRALLIALLLAAIVAFIRARTRLLRQRAEKLEAIVAERTSELATANAALENMSLTDPLTGLRNRRFLMQRIDEDVALSRRQKTDLVFFLVDIDHFKAVNDELGHAAGDRVLEQMRGRLEEVFRSTDYVLRWGGEEFLAVTRGSSRHDAPEIAERLRAAIAGRPFELDGGQQLPKTASIGFAAFPFNALTWMQVVELADQALYLAKENGRNTWFGLAPAAETDGEFLSRADWCAREATQAARG